MVPPYQSVVHNCTSFIHLPDNSTILFDLFVYPHLNQHSCTNSSSTHGTIDCQCRRQRSPRQKITLRDLSDLLWKALLDSWLARFSSHCTAHSLPVHILQRIFRVLTSHLESWVNWMMAVAAAALLDTEMTPRISQLLGSQLASPHGGRMG